MGGFWQIEDEIAEQEASVDHGKLTSPRSALFEGLWLRAVRQFLNNSISMLNGDSKNPLVVPTQMATVPQGTLF